MEKKEERKGKEKGSTAAAAGKAIDADKTVAT